MGCSKRRYENWLAVGLEQSRKNVEVVALDGLTSLNTAASEELPDATAVMAPSQIVLLAGDAHDSCGRRVQRTECCRRGRKGDPLYRPRRTLHKGASALIEKQ